MSTLEQWPWEWFGSAEAIPDPAEQTPETAEEASFWQKVGSFKQKVTEFWDVFGRLQALRGVAEQDPRAAGEYSRLMGAASSITDKIAEVTTTVKSALSWAGGLFGYNNLSALQFIPLAVVLGAVTLITGWLVDARVQLSELEAVDNLIKEGVAPEQAYKLVREKGGLFAQLGGGLAQGLATAALIGAAVWWLSRQRV